MKLRSLISQAVQLLRKYTNYEIRRQRAKDWIPRDNIDIVNVVLPWYRMRFPSITLLQIGAYIGERPLAMSELARSSDNKIILVEPMKMAFEVLSYKYRNFSNVHLCNAAIARHDGQAKIYTAQNITSLSDPQARWSSFMRDHLKRFGLKDDEIREETVEALKLETILDRFCIDDLDILITDTEGFDNEVIEMALDMKTTPYCIYFEHTHFLNRDMTTTIFSNLDEHGYRWVHDKRNTLAVKEEVLDVLSTQLQDNKYDS